MGYEIALVNPRRKPKKRRKVKLKSRGVKVSKKRRRRKMSAAQRKYFGPRKRRASRRRRSTAIAVAAPVRRRRTNPRQFVAKRRRRSNPRLGGSGVVGQVVGTLMPAAIGAAGVLAVDRVLGMLPLAKITADPNMRRHVGRAARLLAVAGVGIAARKFMGGEQGKAIAVSAMGIALHGLISSFIGAPAFAGELDGDLGADYANWSPAPMMGDDLSGLAGPNDDIVPLISGDDMGADDMGAYLDGELDGGEMMGAYLDGDND